VASSALRTGIRATCSTVTVFSLSVSTYVGTPPIARNVLSKQDATVGNVLSRTGITTRNRDQASHAHHSQVRRPSTRGPSPQSNWHHIPGSGIHGRNTRRCPARYDAFATATARRVVRSVPANPIAAIFSWTRSAPMCPCDRSTSSSIFGMNSSIIFDRAARLVGSTPSPRSCTYRFTVWWSHPASSAARR
jgi:hypothetical protein